MKRREFIRKTTLAAGLFSLGKIPDTFAEFGQTPSPPDNNNDTPGTIPKRPYGKTGVMLSVIGFGGIVVMDAEQDDADRAVAEAYERGVNYYDVAPSYGDAEIKLGPALKPYRKKVFLSCKTGQRRYPLAKEEFERSLERLKTDYFDLYQLHAITDIEKDVETAFADDGVMKLLMEEKKAGRIRYLGFSAHSPQAALEALKRYPFDSVMFPVNFAEYLAGDFSPEVLQYCHTHEIAVIALKMLARQRAAQDDPIRQQYPKCWYQPITDRRETELAMAFTFSQPVTTAIPPGDERLLKNALDLAAEVKPITAAQLKTLTQLAEKMEPIFKKTT